MSATTSLRDSSSALSTSTRWVARLVDTTDDKAASLARIALGLVMLPHGAQKALGWFGGHGLSGTMAFFTQKMGIPAPLAALAIATEFLGALALIVGVGSRVAALAVASVMLVAVAMVHLPNGFFMNWSGAQAGEGFEYHVLAVALAAVVIIKGGGFASVDRRLTRRSV